MKNFFLILFLAALALHLAAAIYYNLAP